MDRVRALTDGDAFDRAYESGPGETLVDLVREMAALPVPPSAGSQTRPRLARFRGSSSQLKLS